MKKTLLLFTLFILFTNLVEAQTKEEKKQLKKEAAEKEYKATKDLINSGAYTFIADWATAQQGGRINLLSNPNHLKIDNGNTDAYLPYFGVGHSASVGFGGNSGIEFKSAPENYKIDFNDQKQKITIKFTANNKTESFDIILVVQKGRTANLSISSSARGSISYDGKVSLLEKDQ